MRRNTVRLVTLLLAAGAGWACAQEAAPERITYRVERMSGVIQTDGILDDAPWQSEPTLTLDFETSPGDNIPPKVATEVWITYDDAFLYLAIRAHDPDPGAIKARFTDRDRAFQDDFTGVVLDTFNDERRAYEFFVNPLGVQMDLLNNDVTGNEDESWDAIWSSAGRVTSTGYEVEMAIPFSSLRFPDTGTSITWGIDALRIWPRDQRYRFGSNRIPRGRNCYLCNTAKLEGFSGVHPGRNLEFDPTLTAHHTEDRANPAQPFESDQQADPGLTTRWGITSGVTLNGAINPDFSQVEADSATLTVNTQFAIFYPEKRPFFLEGADFFDTKINAIYTRDIADPAWGVKISGKEGKSAFGAIVAQDDTTNLILPANQSTDLASINSENTSSIFRYRYDLGSDSTIGGLVTSREGQDYHNRVLGWDMLFRHGAEAFRIEMLGSDTEYPLEIQENFDQKPGALRGTSARIVYQHQTSSWSAYAQYLGASDDFRADLGFIPQVGYHKSYDFVEKYWYSENNERWWNKLTLAAETTWTYDRQGNPLQQQVAPYFLVSGRHELYSNVYFGLGPQFYRGLRFDRNFVNWYIEMRPAKIFYFQLETRAGQEIDFENARQGEILRFIPFVRFDLGRHLRLESSNTIERLDVEGGRLYRAGVSDVRVTYQINSRTFVRLITQYFDVSRNPDLYTYEISKHDQALFNQFLFSYKINPQVVLFLGYSDNYQNHPQYNLVRGNRTLFFKVGYAFVL